MFRKMVSLSRIATREVASRGQDVADDVQKETRGFGDMRIDARRLVLSKLMAIDSSRRNDVQTYKKL